MTPLYPDNVAWERFPLAEMLKRGWLRHTGSLAGAKKQARDLISRWAAQLGADCLQPALLRQHVRTGCAADEYALAAWRIRVSLLALAQQAPQYQPGSVTHDFIRDLVRLSFLDNGPLLAREFLLKNGIRFVVEQHLPRTHLDGAAIKLPDGAPLVALTLRYDRLDNFWFTLCHELAHVALHFEGEKTAFIDDLDHAGDDACEKEADHWATEVLIPSDIWKSAGISEAPSIGKLCEFAATHRINPAIPAGRIRKERKNYQLFSGLVGNKQVRKLFTIK